MHASLPHLTPRLTPLSVRLPPLCALQCAAKRWSVLTWRSTMPKDLHLWQAQQRWAWRRA